MVAGYRNLGSKALLCGSLLASSLLPSALADNSTSVPSSSKTFGSGNEQVVVAVNVPEGSDNQDLFFHFEAPNNGPAWAAFGMGQSMDGSLMFVVYESEGNNGAPTISPRLATGHSMPQYTSDVNITVLDGSQVTSNSFIANFQCHDCRTWAGGNVDVTSSSAPFIYAIGPGGNFQSNDQSATIQQHSTFSNGWSLNLKQATGAEGVPLSGTSTGTTGSTGNNSSNTNTTSSNGNDNDGDDGGQVIYLSGGIIFHGGVMSLAFALIYPLGYLFLRLFEKVWLHAGVQSFAMLLTFLGIGSGIAVSKREQISPNLTHPHQIIGLIVFILILATWTIGLIGHRHYKRTQTPHPIMKGHRFLGPTVIALGSMNACIGFGWVGLRGAIVGYIIFWLFISIIVASLVFMKKKRKMRQQAMNSTAAFNFRDAHEQNVPMQPMGPQHGPVEYYNVQPPK